MTLAFEPQTKVSKKVKKFLRAVSDCDINMVNIYSSTKIYIKSYLYTNNIQTLYLQD